MPATHAIAAYNVRRNILASTTPQHLRNCVAWATRLLEQRGDDFEPYHYMLLREARYMQESMDATAQLVASVQGIHLQA